MFPPGRPRPAPDPATGTTGGRGASAHRPGARASRCFHSCEDTFPVESLKIGCPPAGRRNPSRVQVPLQLKQVPGMLCLCAPPPPARPGPVPAAPEGLGWLLVGPLSEGAAQSLALWGRGAPHHPGAFDNSAPGGLQPPPSPPAEAPRQPKLGFGERGRAELSGDERLAALPAWPPVPGPPKRQPRGLALWPAVRQAAVRVHDRPQGAKQLCCWLRSEDGVPAEPQASPRVGAGGAEASALWPDPRSPVSAPLPKPGHWRALDLGLKQAFHRQRSDFPGQPHQAWPFSWEDSLPAVSPWGSRSRCALGDGLGGQGLALGGQLARPLVDQEALRGPGPQPPERRAGILTGGAPGGRRETGEGQRDLWAVHRDHGAGAGQGRSLRGGSLCACLRTCFTQ